MKLAVAWALKFALSYLHSHPALVDEVFAKVEKTIPGKYDDVALELLKKALGF